MIRKANISDIDALCKISSQPGLLGYDGSSNYHEWYRELMSGKDVIFLVYEKKGEVVGMIMGEPILAKGHLLWALGISPEHSGAGIGLRLLKEYEKLCAEMGYAWIYADGYVGTINPKSAKKLGYHTNGHMFRNYVKEL